MPSAADYPSNSIVKLFLIGDSGTGKTGALASLVEAGYKLRILDLDVGLESLINVVRHKDAKLLSSIEYESHRDRMKKGPQGMMIDGAARAFTDTITLLDKWSDGSNPAEWGSNTVLVVDSGTALGRAAFNWFNALNPSAKDKRSIVLLAQNAVEDVIAKLFDASFATNVIFISHVEYTNKEGVPPKGYTSIVGKALGPKIPRYVNTLVLAEIKGTGANAKRIIRTVPTGIVDVKVSNPFGIDAELPQESGLATLFNHLKGKQS